MCSTPFTSRAIVSCFTLSWKKKKKTVVQRIVNDLLVLMQTSRFFFLVSWLAMVDESVDLKKKKEKLACRI